MYPSVATLHKYLTPKEGRALARQVRMVLDGRIPTTGPGKKWEAKLTEIDKLIGTYGIEHIDYDCCRSALDNCQTPKHAGFSYCNAGDTYNVTLVYDEDRGSFYVSTWGDMVERHEKKCSKCRRMNQ